MKAAFALAALLCCVSTATVAENSRDGAITIKDPWARIAPNEDNTVNVFFEVLNMGETSDALVTAYSPAAKKVALRKGSWRGMDFFNREESGIRIKASRRTSFHPGALEVTLSKLTDRAAVGETIPVTLVFRDAGEIVIQPTISNQLLGNRFRK
jgi:copper(I)-binding protein